MNKTEELEKLKEEIDICSACRVAGQGNIVFGEGDVNAKIMFVGEAPGRQEAIEGRPFIGRSGKLLRLAIKDAGLKEKDVYITSPVKFLPNKGTPTKNEIVHARSHFERQVEIINPDIMVLLGRTAVTAVLDEDIPVMQQHGKIMKINGRDALLTIHPAAVLRFPKYRDLFNGDFKKLIKYFTE